MRRFLYVLLAIVVILPLAAAGIGTQMGAGILHPANLNPERREQTSEMLARTGAVKQDFEVRAGDGAVLKGWKVIPPRANGNWVLLYHGVSDNRTGNLGHAEFLLRHGYSV